MDEEIQECFDPENGFMAKVCEYAVPQDFVPANASLLAASSATGMLVVVQSLKSSHSLLVLKSFADAVPSGIKAGSSQLDNVDTVHLSLPSACFWVGWSPDDSLLAAACASGHVIVYGAQHLAMGNTQPLSHLHFPSPRQVAWAGDSRQLYMINTSFELSVVSLAHSVSPKQLQTGVTAVANRGRLAAIADGCGLCVYQQTDAGLSLLLKHPVSVPVDDAVAVIDAMVFIAEDTIVLEVLVTTGDTSPSSPADTPLTDLPSEEVFFKLIELDSATAPTAVTRDALAPERFHNQYAPIPGNSAAAPPKCRRSPSSGPFLSAAAFPGPFPAAVVASSLLQELHFVHLARRLDDGEDGDSGAGPQWWAISNSMDELQVQLPGAQQDGQLVPNYVVGAAAFTCAPGRSTLHPTDGIEPAEDVPQVVFLMSGGQLIVCNVGSFMPEQPHAAVVRPPAPPPPLSFAVAVPEAATAARPVTAAPAAALAPDPAPPPSPPGSDLQVFQDSAEGVPSQRLTPAPVSEDLEDLESEWNDENADDAENATPPRQLMPPVNQPDTAQLPPHTAAAGAGLGQIPLQPRLLPPSSSSASSHTSPDGSSDNRDSDSDASAASPVPSAPNLPPSLSPDAASAPGAPRPVLQDTSSALAPPSLQEVPLSSLQLQGPIQPESPNSAPAGPFGASAAPASTGSLFGDMTAVPAGSQGGGTAAAPASSLFGAPPVVSTSSLFGATAAPPASGGALFGATTAQSASSLFGAATGASTSSLFGTATATSASSLFGGAAPAPGGSLFGAAPAVSTGGMFGAAPPTSTGGLFGSTAAVPASSAFGSAADAPTLPVSSAAGLSAFPGSFGARAGPPATPASAAPATHPKDIPSPESPCLSGKNSSGTSPLCDPAVAPPVFGAAAPFAQPQTSTLAQPLFPDAAGASGPSDPSTGPLHLPTPSTLGPAFVPEIEHEHVGALSGPGPAEIPATAAAPAAAESDSGSHDPGFPDTTIAPLSSRSPSWGHRAAVPRGPGSSGPSPLSSEDAVDAGGSAADEDSADGDDSVDEVLSPAPEVGALVLKGAVSPDPGLVQLLEDKLKMLPTPDASKPPADSPKEHFEECLAGVQRHLEEVRAAAALAEGHAVAQEDLSAVCGRTGELQQMVRWCKTSGREAVLGLARQARACELKLAAVREMLGEQAAQLLGGDGWDSGSSGLDADELPHRDEAPPQRIVQVAHGKVLEAQKVIEDRMSDLEAACDSMEAAQQAKQARTPAAAPAGATDPFTAAAEISRSLAHLRARLERQRATLVQATAPDDGSLVSSALYSPLRAASSAAPPRPLAQVTASPTPSFMRAASPSLWSAAGTRAAAAAPGSAASEHDAYVKLTHAPSEEYAAHAAWVRALVERSARKHLVSQPSSKPELEKLQQDLSAIQEEHRAKPRSAKAASAQRRSSAARMTPAAPPPPPRSAPRPRPDADAVAPPRLSVGVPTRSVTPPLFPPQKTSSAAASAAAAAWLGGAGRTAPAAAPAMIQASDLLGGGAAPASAASAGVAAFGSLQGAAAPASGGGGLFGGAAPKPEMAAKLSAGPAGGADSARARAAHAALQRTRTASTATASQSNSAAPEASAAAPSTSAAQPPEAPSSASLFAPFAGAAASSTSSAGSLFGAAPPAAAAAASSSSSLFGFLPAGAPSAAAPASSAPSIATLFPAATSASASAAAAAAPASAPAASAAAAAPLFPSLGGLGLSSSSASAASPATQPANAELLSSSKPPLFPTPSSAAPPTSAPTAPLFPAAAPSAPFGVSAAAAAPAPGAAPATSSLGAVSLGSGALSLGSLTFASDAPVTAPSSAAIPLFGHPTTAAPGVAQPTTAAPAFGAPAATAATTSFASLAAPAASPQSASGFSAFAAAPAFSSAAAAAPASAFGSVFGGAASTPAPGFAAAAASSSAAFSAFGAAPAFPAAAASTAAPSLFGSQPVSAPSLFGATPASSASLFGSQSTPASQPASAFGQPAFGQPAQLGAGMQGVGGQFGQVTPLGGNLSSPPTATPATSGFGSIAQPQPVFGAAFGGAPTASAAAPVFGAAFGAATAAPGPVFGAAFGGSAPAAGAGGFAAFAQTSAPAFGGGGFAAAAASSASSGFAAFGGGQTFGGGAQPPAFGGAAQPSPFGAFSGGPAAPQVPHNANPAMFAPRR